MKNILKLLAATSVLAISGQAVADHIGDHVICVGPDRTASSTSAQSCDFGEAGNPDNADLQTYYPGDPWNDVGHIDDGTTLSEGFLSIMFEMGGFDSNVVEIAWEIGADFWSTYGEALITIHVGNGNGDPDHFAFLIEEGATSGVLTYERVQGGGGGFSNIVLWARGRGETVPEPGTLALLGGGLLFLGLRRRARRQA